jgi:uncharacterized protein YkwD
MAISAMAQPARPKLISPLSSFSPEWNKDVYLNLNTARDSNYLTGMEKDVIWILNMVRRDPQLFLRTVMLNPKSEFYQNPKYRNSYYTSLVKDLQKLKPNRKPLYPNQKLYLSAFCHALNSGKEGYVGHDRKWGCKTSFRGECCSYGFDDALDIIMQLLIDDGVPSLGHRSICLSTTYDELGVSIQPHIAYSYNAVLDFY